MYTTIFLFLALAVITYFMGVAINSIATGRIELTHKFLKWSPVIMIVLVAMLVLALDGGLFNNYF